VCVAVVPLHTFQPFLNHVGYLRISNGSLQVVNLALALASGIVESPQFPHIFGLCVLTVGSKGRDHLHNFTKMWLGKRSSPFSSKQESNVDEFEGQPVGLEATLELSSHGLSAPPREWSINEASDRGGWSTNSLTNIRDGFPAYQ